MICSRPVSWDLLATHDRLTLGQRVVAGLEGAWMGRDHQAGKHSVPGHGWEAAGIRSTSPRRVVAVDILLVAGLITMVSRLG